MKDLKFRVWNSGQNEFNYWGFIGNSFIGIPTGRGLSIERCLELSNQFTGRKDKNGVDIYEGDILEFADKWEWYKSSYGIKMYFASKEKKAELQEQYDKEPMERREVKPEDYEWLLSSEIQTYWQVIGNIYQDGHLLNVT